MQRRAGWVPDTSCTLIPELTHIYSCYFTKHYSVISQIRADGRVQTRTMRLRGAREIFMLDPWTFRTQQCQEKLWVSGRIKALSPSCLGPFSFSGTLFKNSWSEDLHLKDEEEWFWSIFLAGTRTLLLRNMSSSTTSPMPQQHHKDCWLGHAALKPPGVLTCSNNPFSLSHTHTRVADVMTLW